MKALATLILLFPITASAALLFDNGSPVGDNLGMLYNSNCVGTTDSSCGWTVFEDFTLSDRSAITGLGWSQFDEPLTYLGTTISFFSTMGAAPIISFTVAASRVANGIVGFPNPEVATDVTGYDYFANLGFLLNAGTYFVGIHNEVSGNPPGGLAQTLMANTLGTGQTIAGSFQAAVNSPFEVKGSNFAFQVFGDAVPTSVPEPGALSLFAAGLILLGFMRRRGMIEPQPI